MLTLSEILTLIAISCQVHTDTKWAAPMDIQAKCIRAKSVCAMNEWNGLKSRVKKPFEMDTQLIYLNCLDKQ
jgi:hypothetical protein